MLRTPAWVLMLIGKAASAAASAITDQEAEPHDEEGLEHAQWRAVEKPHEGLERVLGVADETHQEADGATEEQSEQIGQPELEHARQEVLSQLAFFFFF